MKTKPALTYFIIITFFLLLALIVWIWFDGKLNGLKTGRDSALYGNMK